MSTKSLTALADRLHNLHHNTSLHPHSVWDLQGELRKIAAALRQHAAGGWVRSSERLPKEGQDVWVVYGHGAMRGVATATFMNGSFIAYDDDCPMDDPPEWWMPLVYPTAPPEQNTEE